MSELSDYLVRVPYKIGTTVYHKIRQEEVPGLVTGFLVRERALYVLVVWGDDLREGTHSAFELTTEYEPSFMKGSEQ